jgi:hypothetical protein
MEREFPVSPFAVTTEICMSNKLKHWCAFQAKNARKPAPMLEFHVHMRALVVPPTATMI